MDFKNQKKVLIIEDEKEIRELIALYMLRNGFSASVAGTGEEAKAIVQDATTKNFDIDLMIVDWMLPDTSGTDLVQEFRKNNYLKKIPILMLTAKAEPENIVYALESGADDYIIKPFDSKVLIARINALIRRSTMQKLSDEPISKTNKLISAGPIKIDLSTYTVECNGNPLNLTPSELKILQTLVSNVGCVMTREQLIQEVQGEGVNVIGRTIDTHTFALRKKLGDYAECIETIRGVGYRFRE